MDKNYDQVRQDVLDLFLSSRTKVGPCPGAGQGDINPCSFYVPKYLSPWLWKTGDPWHWLSPVPFSHGAPQALPPPSTHSPLGIPISKTQEGDPGRVPCHHGHLPPPRNPSCPSQVVANLFFGHAQVLARQRSLVRRSSTRTRRYKAPTVAARFQQSLLDLVEKMERSGRAGRALVAGLELSPRPLRLMVFLQRRCNPFFVRCLKPNNKKVRAAWRARGGTQVPASPFPSPVWVSSCGFTPSSPGAGAV